MGRRGPLKVLLRTVSLFLPLFLSLPSPPAIKGPTDTDSTNKKEEEEKRGQYLPRKKEQRKVTFFSFSSSLTHFPSFLPEDKCSKKLLQLPPPYFLMQPGQKWKKEKNGKERGGGGSEIGHPGRSVGGGSSFLLNSYSFLLSRGTKR